MKSSEYWVVLPEPTAVFQQPSITLDRIAFIIDGGTIAHIGSPQEHPNFLWLSNGCGFIPETSAQSTKGWSDVQWNAHFSPTYRPLPYDVTFFDSTRYVAPEVVIENIMQKTSEPLLSIRRTIWAYWKVCRQLGINPLLPIAQATLETAFFTSWWWENWKNPAGIGVNGDVSSSKWLRFSDTYVWDERISRYRAGLSFDSIEFGVYAHIGRLLGYYYDLDADIPPTARHLIDYANSRRPIPKHVRGIVQEWGIDALTGTWAVDGDYANKIREHMSYLVAVRNH